MKQVLKKIFAPILNLVEKEEDGTHYEYSPSHRKILAVMGVLFIGVASVGLYFSLKIDQMAGLLPVVIFGTIGFLCLIVAGLGSNKAVAKLWRNRDK